MSAEHTQAEGLLSKDNAKALWRYATRPDILPRIRGLGLHFGHFAYLIALVLHSARLIPQGHPALHASHIGQFGVRQVLAIAANNITWSWRNIDQIAIFGAVVVGLIMMFVQAVLIALYAFLGEAQAQNVGEFFTTPQQYVQTDLVLIMLEQVFGPNLDFFGAASQPLGTPVYTGLHSVLGLYSMATMVIAVVIVIYYIMTVVGEAAQTGTAFGKRFNSLWTPVRLVVALGLLVPLGSNLNSAQYITLWVAKMGSGLATKAWTTFVQDVTAATDIVNKPSGESTTALVQRIFLNEACAGAFNQVEEKSNRKIKILQVTGRRSSVTPDFGDPSKMVKAARDARQDSVILSWSSAEAGERATDYSCGRISISLTEFDVFSDGTNVTAEEERWWWGLPWIGRDMDERLGTIHENVKISYMQEINRLSEALKPAGEAIAKVTISVNKKPEYGQNDTLDFIPDLLRREAENAYKNINATIATTYESITQSKFASSGGYEQMVKRGWGAAGLWYGTLGTINKKYMDAVASAIPTLDVLYQASEVSENERGTLGWLFGLSRYDVPGSATSEIEDAIKLASRDFAASVPQISNDETPLYLETTDETITSRSDSRIARFVMSIFGGAELYDMSREPGLDPMVRMVSGGHNMVSSSLLAFGIGGVSKIASFFGGEEFFNSVAAIAFAIATVGFVAGVFLAYVLPLLPFVYFSFAVIGWILEIFEAVVAMPLWALAHLRIDGDGMPGPTAIQGYHLLLMILIRPALIVIGLIGGYVIFGAAMYYFVSLFGSAVSITRSDYIGDTTGWVGVFVNTVIFVFLAYNIALMCFKMIDDVPKGILRWLGSGVQSFGDSRGDPIGGAREAVIGTVAGASRLYSGGMRGLTGEGDPTGQSKGLVGMGISGGKKGAQKVGAMVARGAAAKATGGASEATGLGQKISDAGKDDKS